MGLDGFFMASLKWRPLDYAGQSAESENMNKLLNQGSSFIIIAKKTYTFWVVIVYCIGAEQLCMGLCAAAVEILSPNLIVR
jgi:hypothetical protein